MQHIKAYFEEHVKKERRVLWSQIPSLQLLPQKVQIHLRYEVCVPVFCRHPVFECLANLHHSMVVELAFRAASESSWEKRRELFCYGGQAVGMLFVLSGTLTYT